MWYVPPSHYLTMHIKHTFDHWYYNNHKIYENHVNVSYSDKVELRISSCINTDIAKPLTAITILQQGSAVAAILVLHTTSIITFATNTIIPSDVQYIQMGE